MNPVGLPEKQGLYDPRYEHDACGVGFVVNMKGKKSHEIVTQALTILHNLDHRGACGCEANTGDGAGILLQIPDAFLRKVCTPLGIALPEPLHYGVGVIFTSPDQVSRERACRHFETIIAEQGQQLLGWRDIPTDNGSLGDTARASEPFIRQVFIGRGGNCPDEGAFDRTLYLLRKRSVNEIRDSKLDGYWYVPSLSCRTLIYKGMLTATQVGAYYPDLGDPAMESALALVHSRFSTNTFPIWDRAHPYRLLAHNGEINTLQGNVNWTRARIATFASSLFGEDFAKLTPIINTNGSDSAMFDNFLELLVMSGRSLPHAVMMMIPEPWENHESMSPELKAFYQYHSCLMEPWDGPASISFTDGRVIGAVLDRNGLRPSRYYVTSDDLVIMASEAGVLPVAPERVLFKGRLQPGRMFLVDTEQGRIIDDGEIKAGLSTAQPYGRWLADNLIGLESLPDAPPLEVVERTPILQLQQAFGYTFEDQRLILEPMARDGIQPLGSMGTDIPLAVLSDQPQLLYNYFKQLFAQVTNPPIDPIREEIVTSTTTLLGSEANLLEPTPFSARLIRLEHPC